MGFRHICEVEEASGKKPVSKWLAKHMGKRAEGRFNARLLRMETNAEIPDEWLKPYVSLGLWELKFDYFRVAYRILCDQRGKEVIMLAPDTKKGKINPTVEAQAKARSEAIKKETAYVRSYPVPGRTSDDLEGPGR